MGRKSVFRFGVNDQNKEYAQNMIKNYLQMREFYYISESNNFQTKPSGANKKDSIIKAFEYYVNGSELVIKAYTLLGKKKKMDIIHFANNEYMIDIMNNLFRAFDARHINKISTSIEEIEEKKNNKSTIIIIILLLVIIGVGAAIFFVNR